MKGGEPRGRRGKQRDAQIVEAAITIFKERGYSNTSVEDIAGAVGILKGSLYYYIDSKEDLLFRIATEVHDAVREMLNEAAARTDLAPLDRLALYAGRQVEYNARNVARISVYHQDYRRLGADRLAMIESRRAEHVAFLRRLMSEAQDAGQIDQSVDVRTATAAVFSTIVWIYTWFRPGMVAPAELQHACVEFLLRGIGAPR